MIVFNGLAHVGIRIVDFVRAIKFYRQLGFKVVREDYRERVVVLKHGSGIELNLLDSVSPGLNDHNMLMDEPVWFAGFTHVALKVSDVKQAERDLKELGIVITEGPVTFGDGSQSIFFRDPDRNVIELSQPDVSHMQSERVVK